MPSDHEHWHSDAKVYDDRVEEIHLISDPTRNIRRKPYTKVWHIERYLGRGSFGEVRLERNRKEEKVRAVKRVITTSSTLSQKECEQELEALLEFSKPKSKDAAIFVEFFGWFQSGFSIYLAMEYIELGDLEQNVQLHSGKLPEVEAQSIAEQILLGLEIMHGASFAHRDLKPQNILVVVGPPQWWVKLADFGLSKRLTDSTAYRTSAGTLPYMAPELRDYLGLATSKEYTNAVDLWAVGCITHRLLTSKVPFLPGKSLTQYCEGISPFPNGPLVKCNVTDSGSKFVQELLVISPKERLSAAQALQHHWFTSCADATPAPLGASYSSAERGELSRVEFSVIEYNTASHAGLKSHGSKTYSETSILPTLNAIAPSAVWSTSKTVDARYSIPRKPLQQNLPLDSKQIVEKDLRASSNETKTPYETEIKVKTSQNSDVESASADNMPDELDFKRGQDLFNDSKYSNAEQVFQQLIQTQEKILGKEEPETLNSKYWLARTLYKQKQYQKAEEVLREVVRGQEKVLGKEAQKTLESKYWLARTLYFQKQYQEAEEVFKEVVRGREKVLGKEEPETLNSKYWLARTLYKQKQYQKAEEVLREVVRGQEKVLGKEAQKTLESKYWLARTLYFQKQYQEAEEVFKEVVRGREKVLGKEDPETLDSKHWLARTLYFQKQYQEAEEVFREVVRGREKVLGREDPETLDSKRWLAKTVAEQKTGARLMRSFSARMAEIFIKDVRGQEKVLGIEHCKTVDSR